MKLLLDEMYPATVAAELRSRGFDVVSVHDPEYRHLEGASDKDVFSAGVALERAIVTENVSDFRQLETEALARGASHHGLVYTTHRQFPRRGSESVGRLVLALSDVARGAAVACRLGVPETGSLTA